MCGICGVVALSPTAQLPSQDEIQKMATTLEHRGPDDFGYLHEPGAVFGHRRLSIIDVAGGRQPIANEDQTRFIVYNGEIYNHQEIRHDLEAKGHRYRTSSDTETLLHLVEQDGVEGLNRLNGIWAFAIWDRNSTQALIARDRMGVKPLYYAQTSDVLIFASEIKAILEWGGVDLTLDPTALAAYLECQYVPGPRTIFRSIKKIPPGHALQAGPRGVRLSRYWNPNYQATSSPSFEEAGERINELLTDAVRQRLLSEVPLGAFLSGGIDSSIVVGLMTRITGRPVKTFTVGFRGQGWYDESPEAVRVAKHFETDHHTLPFESLDLPTYLEQAARALDEPMADPASIPTYLISRFARQKVTVALTGEGADEIFGGYDHYLFQRLVDTAGPLANLAARVGRILPRRYLSARAWKTLQATALKEPYRHLRIRSSMSLPEVQALMGFSLENLPRATLEAVVHGMESYPSQDPVNRLLFRDTVTWLPDDLLMKVDKMSMLASLEARVPYLDYRLVEYLFSLPGSFKIKGGRTKLLLRHAFRDLLPESTLRRRKHGFGLPIREWLNSDLKDYARDIFASRQDSFYDSIEPKAVQKMLDDFYQKKVDLSLPLWTLLNLKVWCRQYLATTASFAGPSL